ncbi:MAG TPA: lasso peptide biosynthesis B2 protein [Thermoleophilaceae bacterium]|jgi:hypothetical protein
MSAATDLSSGPRLAPGAKLALAGEVLASYARVRWRLRGAKLPEVLADLRAAPPRRPGLSDAVAGGRRLGRVVSRTLALVPADSRCLVQSLTLTRMLASRGVESRLVIGVRPGERFAAHAWVEHDGMPLLPTGGDRFDELLTL